MADGSTPGDVPQGRILRENADQLVMACLVCLSASRFDDTERETAIWLLDRALPLASRSTRMEVLRPLALSVLSAAPARRKPEGASAWCRAMLELDCAMSRDALTRALALVEV